MISCAAVASAGRLRPVWSKARTIRPATRSSGFLGSSARYFFQASAAWSSLALPASVYVAVFGSKLSPMPALCTRARASAAQAAGFWGVRWVARTAAFSALSKRSEPVSPPEEPVIASTRPPCIAPPPPIPNSTRPPPMSSASVMYTIFTVRRRPRPLRSNSIELVHVLVLMELGVVRGGRPGLLAVAGAGDAPVEQRCEEDRALVEHQQGRHQDQHRHGILTRQQRGDDRDDHERVAAALAQLARRDDAEPRRGEDPDRDLEQRPHRDQHEDLERVEVPRLEQDVVGVVVEVLQEADRGRQHEVVGEDHAGEEQERHAEDQGYRHLPLAGRERGQDERVRLVE